MKILMINPSSDLYGANRILLTVLQKLSAQHSVTLYLPEEGPLSSFIRKNDSGINLIIRPNMPLIGRKLNTIKGIIHTANSFRISFFYFRKEIKHYEPDIVYINTLAGFPMIFLFRLLQKKILVHVHEILETPRLITNIINKYAVKWADQVICVSEPVRQNLLLSVRDSKMTKKVAVILNGIDDKQQTISSKNNDKVIVTLIGRITRGKGIWFFLDTICLLPADMAAKCEFRIIGGPAPGRENLIDTLQADIAGHVYSSQIVFIQFMENITPMLNETDILVVPSLMRESFPTTILEGLSAGKPVIATNTGGAIQSIASGVDGILIDAGDNVGFANHLAKMIENPKVREVFGVKARQKFLAKFQVSRFQDDVAHFIDEKFPLS
ncbi:glycosyltransferase family 4 protein [Chitinophaga sp.]|uniref:glycosyltransferase family 4 protein n=1 Tax=Chitinophaga sp. TaxID=1869181 RepID=UPI002F939217